MPQPASEYSIRDCSRAVMAVIERYETAGDADRLRSDLLRVTRPLIERADLLKLGVKREANHITNSRWLYYDGRMSITLDELPKGKKIPPHDHGIWEALVICSGRVRHTVYERIDDGTVAGHADLRAIEDRDLGRGEIAMVVPPTEIHSFLSLEDSTFALTVVGGEYKPLRHYYQVEEKTYVVRTPKALKESGALG